LGISTIVQTSSRGAQHRNNLKLRNGKNLTKVSAAEQSGSGFKKTAAPFAVIISDHFIILDPE